jgi:uncharacterized membrane protein
VPVGDHRTHEIKMSASFKRGSEEFSRVLAFSDGLFAIAMTLLVVAIAVPQLADAASVGDLAESLDEKSSEFVSFFISFAVIGRYWVAHHQFFARLASMDGGLVTINLVYLAFIAFLPFPTDLLGTYFENPLSIAIYAVNVAIVSGLEVVLFRHAHQRRLMRDQLPAEIYRWGVIQSASPVLFFLLSVPVAFVSTELAVACWFLTLPFAIISDRWKPAGAEDFFG